MMKRVHVNFAGLGERFSRPAGSKIVVLPVPYDRTSTWGKGADEGPFAVLEASPALEYYDIETDYEVYREGIYTHPPLTINSGPEKMVSAVEKTVTGLIDKDKFVVVLGGEHSVSIGAVKAFSHRAKDFSVLQLDAHSDLRDEYLGSRFNHACVGARIKELCPLVQVGIRSMDIEEKPRIVPENVFFAESISGKNGWMDEAVKRLSDNVYVTIDMDVFDPSIIPSTGTPEPGGLTWYEVIALLRLVSEKKNVVGFDCVELCPQPGNRAPDFITAKLIYKFLTYIFKNRSENTK